MTALTKIYNANLDIVDANIQDVSGDVTKSTYIRIPITLPASGQISLSIGGYDSEVEQPSPYIDSATLRGLDVLVAGYNRDRAKSVPFTFQNMLFGGNSQVNNVIVWAGRNAANELLLAFEIEGATAVGSGAAAPYQDIRNVDPNPLVVNHLAFSPEDSFNLPTTDDSAAIVDTDLMVMLPAGQAVGQTRVDPVMQSWADLKSDVGAASGASVAANTAAIATNKGNVDTNTANIATNTAGIAANLATLNALPDYGPPGMTADFLITSWEQHDTIDGTPADQVRWEYENATNQGTLGTPSDRVADTISRTIERVEWFQNGKIRLYSVDGSDAAWGGGFTANTALSLYVYTVGLPSSLSPSDDPTVTEYELVSGTTGTWGAGGTYVEWTAAIPTGFTDQVDVRFLIADKGEVDRISVFVGAADTATNKAEIAANTANIATNATGIATNLASINALPSFGVENIVADFTITSWDLQDSADGVTQTARFYRWNAAPNPTGAIAAGADLTFTPGTVARTIHEVRWYPQDATSTARSAEFRIYPSATDAAWSADIIGNTELSLYAYLQGLPNAPQRINELPLKNGKTFGRSPNEIADGVEWSVDNAAQAAWGITAEATAVRFIIADKGQGARIAILLGIANNGIPEIVPYSREIPVSPAFSTAMLPNIWYEIEKNLPFANDSPTRMYSVSVSAGLSPRPTTGRLSNGIVIANGGQLLGQMGQLPDTVVSGTTVYSATAHQALFLPTGASSGFLVSQNTSTRHLWAVAVGQPWNPTNARFNIERIGFEGAVP